MNSEHCDCEIPGPSSASESTCASAKWEYAQRIYKVKLAWRPFQELPRVGASVYNVHQACVSVSVGLYTVL